jgi:hypothetical protein
MKISPVASGGTPGQNLGGATTERTSPDKKAAAIEAFVTGKNGIKVTKSDTYVDPQVAKAEASIRRIKMRTNASPLTLEPELTPESTIPDPVEQVNATLEETKPLTPQFAALAKQRRALQIKEREIADREKALDSKPATNAGFIDPAQLKSDPLSVLQQNGVTYDQLTEAIMANGSGVNPEIRAMQAELKALKEGIDTKFVERETAQETQVLAEMQREAEVLVKSGDDYEMVRETKSLPDAMDLIKRTYKTTGEVLEVSEALRLVEEDLVNESLKIAKIKKVQSRLTPAEALQTQQPQKTMRTLTNRDNASTTMDRKARAIAAFHNKLK